MTPTPSFPVVLFDLDGTLIDTIELIRRCHFHTWRVHFGREPSDADWLHSLGRPLRDQFRAIVATEEEVETMITTYRAFNDEHHDRLLRRFDGAVDAVVTLRERGRRLGIVTSKLGRSARRGLTDCGFDPDWFEVVIGADDVERHKPDPTPVRAALERLGADPKDAVYVGDSPHDLAAGRGAGTATAAAMWGPFPRELLLAERPDLVLEEVGQIADL